MIATDEILRFRMEEVEALNEADEIQEERWTWHNTHDCPKNRVALLRLDGKVFTEPCCPECYTKVWKPEGAALFHQHTEHKVAA